MPVIRCGHIIARASRFISTRKTNTLAFNYDNNYITVTFLLIIFFFHFKLHHFMLRFSLKIPLPNPRMQLHRHLQTFLHRNTQKQRQKWMYTKKALHSLAIQCVRRTNTGSDFICTLNQPAESSHSSQTTPCGHLMPASQPESVRSSQATQCRHPISSEQPS